MTKKLFMFLMILFLFSCWARTVTTELINSEARPPVPFNEVRIYRSIEQVKYPFDEIAFLYTVGTGYGKMFGKHLKSLKEEAGRLGANAVIIDTEKDTQLAIFVHY